MFLFHPFLSLSLCVSFVFAFRFPPPALRRAVDRPTDRPTDGGRDVSLTVYERGARKIRRMKSERMCDSLIIPRRARITAASRNFRAPRARVINEKTEVSVIARRSSGKCSEQRGDIVIFRVTIAKCGKRVRPLVAGAAADGWVIFLLFHKTD